MKPEVINRLKKHVALFKLKFNSQCRTTFKSWAVVFVKLDPKYLAFLFGLVNKLSGRKVSLRNIATT